MGKPISQVKRYANEAKWEDEVDWIEFPDDKMVLIRIVGDIEVLARHWITTTSGKRFPMWCPKLNEREDYEAERWCPAHDDFDDKSQKLIIGNCIVRHLQERREPNPVRGFMIPHAAYDDVFAIFELIKGDPADPQRGVDLAVRYSPKAVGNRKWSIQRGDTTPLTDDERRYRYFDFSKIIPNFADKEVATHHARLMKESMARHKYYVIQNERVPQGARDPFKYFRGDLAGQPWTQFAVLVDFRNQQKGESAQSYRVSAPAADGTEQTIETDDPSVNRPQQPPPPPRATDDGMFGAPQSAPAVATNTPQPSEPPVKRSVADVRYVQHPKFGRVPECFGQFSGLGACITCDAPTRDKCIETDSNM